MDKRYVKLVVSSRPVSVGGTTKTFGTHGPFWMTTKDIFTCLANGAKVYDVSVQGKEVQLNFTNYLEPVKGERSVNIPPAKKPTTVQPVRSGNFHPTNEPVLNKNKVHEDPALPVFVENTSEPEYMSPVQEESDSNDQEPVQQQYYNNYKSNKKNKKH